MKIDDSSLFFTCSLLELIGRTVRQTRSAVTELLGKKVISHIYTSADVLHCEPIAKTAEVFIDMCKVPHGEFDNITSCKYDVPDYWTIGKVYARLIEDVAESDVVDTLFKVYNSAVSNMISNYNSDFFYQSRDYIKEYFIANGDPIEANRKKPTIRFSEFTDAWEQRQVSELLQERNEQAPQNSQYPLMAFIANIGVAPKGERYDRSSLVTDTANKFYKRTEHGDFIYSSNNLETGSIGLNQYGKASISPVYSIFHPTGFADSNFIGRRMVRKDFVHEMVKWRQGVIYGQWRIHETDFLQIKLMVPSTEEQQKIGCFLDHLDRLITLHQRKYDKLSKIKKSMLEKLFPKNGSNIPEIRFAGFTDTWEQRRLGDISEKITEKNVARCFSETFTNSAENGIINQQDYFDHAIFNEANLNGYYVVREEDFVYNPRISVTAPVGPINRNKLRRTGVISPLYTVFRPHDIDNTFLEYFFKSNYWHPYMEFNGDTGARSDRFSIKDSVFFEMPIPYPESKEQQKIGSYLTGLDRLLTLHQRELEKLKKLKQSCLEKMFV